MKKKILTVANYLTDDSIECFRRNKSGYGYVVADIVCGLSASHEVAVLLFSGSHKEFVYNKCRILDNRVLTVLAHVKVLDILGALKELICFKWLNYEIARIVYSRLAMGYVRNVVRSFGVVHVHGCTPNLIPHIKTALNEGVRVVVTLHGLNSFSSFTKASDLTKKSEREIFGLAKSFQNLHITVLTPAAKEMILPWVGKARSQVHVIPNFLREAGFPAKYKANGAVSRCNDGKRVVLYVGNVSKQKNQESFLRAILENHDDLVGDYRFIFVGELCYELSLEGLEHAITEGFIDFRGHIARREVQDLYRKADLTVLLSRAEGFGMSVIEGFYYGVPALISKNIEISSLIGDKDFITYVQNETDSSEIFDALLMALGKEIDLQSLYEYSVNFSEKAALSKYESVLLDQVV